MKMTHQAMFIISTHGVLVKRILFSGHQRLFFGRKDGRTPRVKNNDHLFGHGLVGQKEEEEEGLQRAESIIFIALNQQAVVA